MRLREERFAAAEGGGAYWCCEERRRVSANVPPRNVLQVEAGAEKTKRKGTFRPMNYNIMFGFEQLFFSCFLQHRTSAELWMQGLSSFS